MADHLAIPDDASTDPRTPTRSADGHPLARLKPANHQQVEETVELLARVSKGMVKIRTIPRAQRDGTIPPPTFCAVHPWRLADPITRRPLTRADVAALPWQGKGDDPASPEASQGKSQEGQA